MQVIANVSMTVSEIGIKGFANMPIVKADLVKTVCKVLDEAKSTRYSQGHVLTHLMLRLQCWGVACVRLYLYRLLNAHHNMDPIFIPPHQSL
jgi:hypothetical protein